VKLDLVPVAPGTSLASPHQPRGGMLARRSAAQSAVLTTVELHELARVETSSTQRQAVRAVRSLMRYVQADVEVTLPAGDAPCRYAGDLYP